MTFGKPPGKERDHGSLGCGAGPYAGTGGAIQSFSGREWQSLPAGHARIGGLFRLNMERSLRGWVMKGHAGRVAKIISSFRCYSGSRKVEIGVA
jgi:hypothetical protein